MACGVARAGWLPGVAPRAGSVWRAAGRGRAGRPLPPGWAGKNPPLRPAWSWAGTKAAAHMLCCPGVRLRRGGWRGLRAVSPRSPLFLHGVLMACGVARAGGCLACCWPCGPGWLTGSAAGLGRDIPSLWPSPVVAGMNAGAAPAVPEGGGGDDSRRDRWKSTITNVSGFLGGFSLASVVVISAGPDSFRWPGWAALVLAIASVLLLAAAQEARRASRQYSERHEGWHRVIWVAYHTGIVALLAGLGAALAPKADAVTQLGLRWGAMWVAFGAAAVELFLPSCRQSGRTGTPWEATTLVRGRTDSGRFPAGWAWRPDAVGWRRGGPLGLIATWQAVPRQLQLRARGWRVPGRRPGSARLQRGGDQEVFPLQDGTGRETRGGDF
jgi:hypothetical protein